MYRARRTISTDWIPSQEQSVGQMLSACDRFANRITGQADEEQRKKLNREAFPQSGLNGSKRGDSVFGLNLIRHNKTMNYF